LAQTDGLSVDMLEVDQAQLMTTADEGDETKSSLTTGPGNLELVMQIIAQMCDGQNKDLQVKALHVLYLISVLIIEIIITIIMKS